VKLFHIYHIFYLDIYASFIFYKNSDDLLSIVFIYFMPKLELNINILALNLKYFRVLVKKSKSFNI